MATSLRTPTGMLMFEHCFVAKPVTQGGEPRFNIVLVFDEAAQKTPEYLELRRAAVEAIDEKFGAGKSRDAAFMKNMRSPFNDAADKKQYSGFRAGMTYITPWTKSKPGIVDGNRNDITAPADVWAGQMARATVTCFAYEKGANKGVNFMLNNIQITKADMPRMDGRRSATDDFDAVPGASTVPADADLPF